jgi:hypothetical protein
VLDPLLLWEEVLVLDPLLLWEEVLVLVPLLVWKELGVRDRLRLWGGLGVRDRLRLWGGLGGRDLLRLARLMYYLRCVSTVSMPGLKYDHIISGELILAANTRHCERSDRIHEVAKFPWFTKTQLNMLFLSVP